MQTPIRLHPLSQRTTIACRRWGCLILSIPCALVGVFLLFISVLSPPALASDTPALLPQDFMKGITYESWWNGEFASANSDRTLGEIVLPSGANWLAVVVKCFQETRTSTNIQCQTDRATASDDELRHVIRRAHSLGLKVMFKPHLDLLNLQNSSDGRFRIGFGVDESAWAAWFASYTRFITHYAALAQETDVDYFVVGTELWGTVHRADNWRAVIRAVRAVYDGPLTYAALTYFEPLQISWWDALDAIGIDAYFTVTLTKNPTWAQMKLGWKPTVAYLGWLAGRWNKPIIITEAGYMSVDGTNILPGDWSLQGELDMQEQADAYQALIESFQGQSWWQGIFWWSLSTDPEQGGPNDRGYSFHNKPAEVVLRRFFGGES
ncbi:MAG: hypothetical protein HZC41_26675 [Chloroflexi bacterium]|nr:hypothetical protein [Chloroflexota bacterium]